MPELSLTQKMSSLFHNTNNKTSLAFLFLTFLKIGSLAFGGYMALISVIENTIVKKHQLLSHQSMLDGISLANMLPGPIAVNVVAFTGYRIRGYLGAIVTTIAVLLPSFLLILGLSYIYFNYGEVANFKNVFAGFMPAVAAIVFSVAWRLGKKTLTGNPEYVIAIAAALVLLFIPQAYKIYSPISLIVISGLVGYFLFNNTNNKTAHNHQRVQSFSTSQLVFLAAFFIGLLFIWFYPLPLEKNSALFLMLTFASMSLMLFGGGYVFIPVIGSVVVLQNGWLTTQEFNDGIALGQVTPGPILLSATFIGYKVAGFWGALLSTIGIFGIPALLMIIVSRWFDFLSQSANTKAVMHGIHCAVIGMIMVAALIIFKSSYAEISIAEIQTNWPLLIIFIFSLIGLVKFNLDVIWIIPPAGLIGYLFL